jgi:hypothetical protein
MRNPIPVTVIFGLLSGLSIFPLVHFAASLAGWTVALNFYVLINLTLYAFLLCLWSRKAVISIAFPLLLVTAMALWPDSSSAFVPVALGVFGWIRSAICFKELSVRIVLAEIVTIIGGAGFLLFWTPTAASGLALAIWFFFLVQTLYFYIVPDKAIDRPAAGLSDPFEHARLETERILKSGRNVQA